jgi:hypothetical protein
VHTFGALQTVLSVQLVLHAPLPLHQYAPHSLSGSVPAADCEHVPAVTVLQFMHVPRQSELQQTPSVQ